MRNYHPSFYYGNLTVAELARSFNQSEAETEVVLQLYWVSRIIILVFHPPLFLLGLIGNTLSFCVLVRRVKHSSTYTYLCSLCVADNLFLIGFCTYWLVQAASDGSVNLFDYDCNFTNILSNHNSEKK